MEDSLMSPYMFFARDQWSELRNSEPMTLTELDLQELKGINEELSVEEVQDVYLPLSRLLSYYVNATSNRQTAMMKFLNKESQKIPFIIGIAGSVSVGKSTTARVLQALISKWRDDIKVSLITTDGFLYPNAILEEKGLMLKKGFPQSYNIQRLLEFVREVKSGKKEVLAPKYSHDIYDIVPDQYEIINQPDVLIIEGLNVLQSGMDYPRDKPRVFVSDYLNFSIYVDAEEHQLEEWYMLRSLKFREIAKGNKHSYFYKFTLLPEQEAKKVIQSIWREINRKNLRKNILPTRERASLILHKAEDHKIDYVRLRK